MEPEEVDPGQLVGRHVVEVGMRQAWPFLTFAHPDSGREVRVYVDASVRVSPDAVALRQDDTELLAALDRVAGLTVDAARVVDGGLELTLDHESLWIAGEANDLTTHAPWWVGLQSLGLLTPPRATGPMTVGASPLLAKSHLPLTFDYPADFRWIVARGLVDLDPWRVLQGEPLAQKQIGLRKRYPETTLIAFASRADNDHVACWDLDLPSGQVVVIQDWAPAGQERHELLADFPTWLKRAVEECLALGAQRE